MILVTGATGSVGGQLVRQLCATGAPVRALARTPERADTLRGYDCDVAIGEYEDADSLAHALRRVSKVFLVSPTSERQRELEGNVIAACLAAATEPHIVKLAAAGVGAPGAPAVVANHAPIVEQLRTEDLPYTVLAPAHFMQNLVYTAATVQQSGELYFPAGDARIPHVDTVDVAAVAAHVLTSDGHAGKTYTITGPEALTYGEVADRMAAMIGREVKYVDVAPDEARDSLTRSGVSPWVAAALVELNLAYREGFAPEVTDEVEKAAGRPARTVDDFLADHRAAFGSPPLR